MKRSVPRRFRLWCIVVGFVALLVGLAGSFHHRGLEAHEIFVAQTSRQMMAANSGSGDFVRPVFNDQPRLNKPPLMYWAVIGVAKVIPSAASVEPWVARVPSAFASALMAIATIWLGRSLVNGSVGVLAGLTGVGSIGWVAYSNNARPEMLYAACCVSMLACFAWVWRRGVMVEGGAGRRETWVALIGWFLGGLAILAKGPQIPFVIALGFVTFALMEGKAQSLARLRPVSGLLLMLAVPLPWVLMLLAREPNGWTAWTRDLFAGRAGETGVGLVDYLKPYYLYSLPGLLLPWSLLLPWGVIRAFKPGRPERWGLRLCFWLLVVSAVVMSLTIHRRAYYLLSLMPVMSVLVCAFVWSWRGAGWVEREGVRRQGPWLLAGVVLVVCSVVAASPWAWSDRRDRVNGFASIASEAAAREIGQDALVVAWREDPTFLVYARNQIVPRISQIDRLIEVIGQGDKPFGIYTNRQGWDELESAYHEHAGRRLVGRVIAEHVGTGRDADESAVLMLVERGR